MLTAQSHGVGPSAVERQKFGEKGTRNEWERLAWARGHTDAPGTLTRLEAGRRKRHYMTLRGVETSVGFMHHLTQAGGRLQRRRCGRRESGRRSTTQGWRVSCVSDYIQSSCCANCPNRAKLPHPGLLQCRAAAIKRPSRPAGTNGHRYGQRVLVSGQRCQ